MQHAVVVTGSSQGIGAAVAERLAGLEGVHLALVARNEKNLEAVAGTCRAAGAEARSFPCSLTDQDAVRRMAGSVCDWMGVPSLVLNNAGSFVPGSLVDTDVETFEGQLAVNLTSAFMVSRAFAPGMVVRGSGHLMYMGSVASVRGYPGGLAYCAAKHGLLGLARGLREELKPKGIRVTTILPGATLTPSWDGTELPADRFIPAEDIAAVVRDAYLLSGRSVVEEILIRPQLGDL